MTTYPYRLDDLQSVDRRPGMWARNVIGTEHGITSFFVDELRMEDGVSVPLHTHPVEEAWVVTDGRLTVQVGDEIVIADAESVVRIPPGVPHAVRNEGPDATRALAGAAWNRRTFFSEGTTYLEGEARTD